MAPSSLLFFTSHNSPAPFCPPFCFHTLTTIKFCNPFVFTFIHIARGCVPPSTRKIMNSTITNSSSTLEIPAVTPQSDSLRCRHHFSNGKRCRLPGLASQSGLCSRHFLPLVAASPQYPNDFTDLSEDLLPGHTHFSSSE